MWLKYVWAFKKNFIGNKRVPLRELFLFIIKTCKMCNDDPSYNETGVEGLMDPEKKIEIVCEWMLDFTDENTSGSSNRSNKNDSNSSDSSKGDDKDSSSDNGYEDDDKEDIL